MTKYRRVYQSFNDLIAGLMRAQGFYSEMKETVSSLHQNVETFVNNRRSEGGQLLNKIEQNKSQGADQEQQRLKELMERMSMEPSESPNSAAGNKRQNRPSPLSSASLQQSSYGAGSQHPAYNPAASPPVTPRYPMTTAQGQYQQPYGSQNGGFTAQHAAHTSLQSAPARRDSYNQSQPHTQSYNPNT